MGLDLLDVTFRIEKQFHIDLPREEFVGLVKNQDIVVGDIYELILKKMHLRDVGRQSLCVNEYLWSELRQYLQSVTGEQIEHNDLGLRLESLFPRESRRARWTALRDSCPYKVAAVQILSWTNVARWSGKSLSKFLLRRSVLKQKK